MQYVITGVRQLFNALYDDLRPLLKHNLSNGENKGLGALKTLFTSKILRIKVGCTLVCKYLVATLDLII